MLLHTVNKSPFERNALQSCLRMATKGSAVLLMEDGVYGALDNTKASSFVKDRSDVKFYVLTPDLEARGIADKALIDGIEQVDYAGFVDLVTQYDATEAWL